MSSTPVEAAAAATTSTFITWIVSTGPTSALFPTLPYHISLLPALFRFLAFLFFLPVLILALTDIIGWTVFKLILRPLGYASTIRFKDPEPSTLVSPSSHRPTSHSPKKAVHRGSTTSNHSRSPSASDESPAISYAGSSSSRSASASPSVATIDLPSTTTRPSRHRSDTGSSSSSISSMNRFTRANSVGVEGPLFAGEELQSPARSDDEKVLEDRIETSESDGEELSMRRRRGRGVPRGGPAFGMTEVAGSR